MEYIPLFTNIVHWAFGTMMGAVYGLAHGTLRANPKLHRPLFGTGVWAMSYMTLVPMGLYEPPWSYPAKTIAKDISYRLVYGAGTAAGYELVAKGSASLADARQRPRAARRSGTSSAGASAPAIGRSTKNVDPEPCADSTEMRPPIRRTSSRQT